MPTCSCMCSELIFRCYCERPRTNVIHLKKLEMLPNFGWNIESSAITPAVTTAPVAPQALLDVVSCSCTAEYKACSSTRCSCNSAGLSCTDYCKCEGGDICCSAFISKQMDIEDDEGGQVSMTHKYTLCFLVIIYMHIEKADK